MLTKYILIAWIGAVDSQSIAMDTFATRAECEGARTATIAFLERSGEWIKCIPFTYEIEEGV